MPKLAAKIGLLTLAKKETMFKRIDRFIFTSFIPPFIVSFAISLFVLVMQILWVYIDELAGKGLGFFMVIELLAYRCVSVIPMALPLGMLLASVMVMGNMAEFYELSSIKSAGVSLLRMMAPLMVFGAMMSLFSWYCSDTLIPEANLQFGSRMFDIQQKKPALQLDEGLFNDDFLGYSIYFAKRLSDGKTIKDVIIYDQSEGSSGKITQIMAKSGEMFNSQDGQYFIMRLRDGHQYIDSRNYQSTNQSKYPFVRTGFKLFTKIFDLSEFKLNRTNIKLFTENRQMMTAGQLKIAADSMGQDIDKRQSEIYKYIGNYITLIKEPDTSNTATQPPPSNGGPIPTTTQLLTLQPLTGVPVAAPAAEPTTAEPPSTDPPDDNTVAMANKNFEGTEDPLANGYVPPNSMPKIGVIGGKAHFYEIFGEKDLKKYHNKVETVVRAILNQTESMTMSLDQIREQRAKFIYDRQTKYSIAVVCFIFLFIGAPMGAIIRKGGFGYPILISIIFFMIFVIMTIFCRKVAETFVVPAVTAAWIPCMVLFPVGIFLTIQAMNDTQAFQMNGLKQLLAQIGTFIQQKFKKYALVSQRK